MEEQRKKKRRHGPAPKQPSELRRERVSVYFTNAELAQLVARHHVSGRALGRVLRDVGLNRAAPQVPAINLEAWSNLARVAGNLNQYQAAINLGNARGYPPNVINELRDLVQALRFDLICLDHTVIVEEGEE